MSTAQPSKAELEKVYDELSLAQKELNDQIQSREMLEMQEQENKIVLEEFQNIGDDAQVYKQTGPVLLPQSKSEAESNVTKRLEFIKIEIERVEKTIGDKQQKVSIFFFYGL